MRFRRWTIAAGACMLAVLGNGVIAQSVGTKRPPTVATSAATKPSTLSGVYTAEQAVRGKDVYMTTCRSCHTPASHTGAVFNKWWRGKKLSDLYGFVSTQMPKNDPGSLAAEDAADVVAYLLKMNAMPVGKDELYPDADSLKKFRIETKKSTATTTAKGTKP